MIFSSNKIEITDLEIELTKSTLPFIFLDSYLDINYLTLNGFKMTFNILSGFLIGNLRMCKIIIKNGEIMKNINSKSNYA